MSESHFDKLSVTIFVMLSLSKQRQKMAGSELSEYGLAFNLAKFSLTIFVMLSLSNIDKNLVGIELSKYS